MLLSVVTGTTTTSSTTATVSSVTASTADGSYADGVSIGILVNFSRAVTVTGIPQLTLETGANDAVANYVSGSGTSSLLFRFAVSAAASHTSADLQYVSTSALSLNGGTIVDSANNAAVLTLPALGSASSLAGSAAIVIDTTAPTVSNADNSSADGAYKDAANVDVILNFSEAVTVTGTPQLTLETGATDAVANYLSGSGTSALVFRFTVSAAASHTSSDLNYQSTSALALNGGTIKDAAGNNATLTLPALAGANSLASNAAIVIDTTAPTVTGVDSSTAAGNYTTGQSVSIQVHFSEVVTVTGTPQLTLDFATDYPVDYASGSGTNTLTFTYTVQAGQSSSDLDYAATTSLALNGGTIRDAAANNATLTLASPGAANSLGANEAITINSAGGLNLEVPIELFDYGLQPGASVAIFNRTRTSLDTGDYDGTVTYYFEIVGTNQEVTSRDVQLVNSAGTVVSTITMTAGTATPTRFETTFTPTAGANNYRIKLPTASDNMRLYAGRIKVKQVGATKTKIYIPMSTSAYAATVDADSNYVAYTETWTTTTYSGSKGNPQFKKVAANWGGTIADWSLEVVAKADAAGATTVGLHDLAGNLVTGAEVTTAATTPTLLTATFADNATNFTDGTTFRLRGKTANLPIADDGATLYKANLWVRITSLTKGEVYYRMIRQVTLSAAQQYQRAKVNTGLFSNAASYHEALGNDPAGDGDAVVVVNTGSNETGTMGSSVSGSDLSGFAVGTFYSLARTASTIVVPDGSRYIPGYVSNGGANVVIACSYIVVQFQ